MRFFRRLPLRRLRLRPRRLLLLLVGLALGLALYLRFGWLPAVRELVIMEVDNETSDLINEAVDAYIAQHYPEPTQRKAAEQFARAMQLAVTGGSASVDAARSIRRQSSEAISCLYDRFDGTNGSKYPAAVGKELTRITTNTKPRLKAYLAYNKTLSGTSWATPEGDNCEK